MFGKLNLTSEENLTKNSTTTSNGISSRRLHSQKIHFSVGIAGDVIFWIVCIDTKMIMMFVTWVWLMIILKGHLTGVSLMNSGLQSEIGFIWILWQYNSSRFHVGSKKMWFQSIRVLHLETYHSGIRFRYVNCLHKNSCRSRESIIITSWNTSSVGKTFQSG